MGLQERLQAAKRQREGTRESGGAERVESVTGIPDAANEATGSEGPSQRWGFPGPCPECGGKGYLDHIDLIDRLMYQHCLECGHKWILKESELVNQA